MSRTSRIGVAFFSWAIPIFLEALTFQVNEPAQLGFSMATSRYRRVRCGRWLSTWTILIFIGMFQAGYGTASQFVPATTLVTWLTLPFRNESTLAFPNPK